jgi:hypothetical protein
MVRQNEQFVNTTATIGTSATTVCREQGFDQVLFRSLVNTSTGGQVIYLAFDKEAVSGEGIALNVGGSVDDSTDGAIMPSNAFISAISSGAGGTLAISERILKRS